MADDLRRDQKTNRRRAKKEVKRSQAAAGAKPKAKKLKGFDLAMSLFEGTIFAADAKRMFNAVAEPDKSVLIAAHKINMTFVFLIMACQKELRKKRNTAAAESIAAFLDEVRKNAKVVKDLVNSMMRIRQQYYDEDHDNSPDAIELIGAETLRSQLTTSTITPTITH